MLIYDTTNFFSFLAEQTPSDFNEKGDNKAFRHHLRQVGPAVSVVRGLGLPLIHELYGGSEHDATLFPSAISRTVERVRELSSLSLRLWVTRSGKLFKIISDRSKLQEKLFAILALQKIASALGAQTDSS
ncbi:MAG: hypothetical protein WBG50_01540 [Desulfomonilaceae bacterium]